MPAAARYAALRCRDRVEERQLFPARRTPGELELQARWFAGDFGREFTTVDGHRLEVIHFGVWNREAGPDFTEAVIQMDARGPLRGSVEFDLIDRNWETHGHATNPAFANTVLHVFVERSPRTFFTRTDRFGYVPQVQVDLALLAGKIAGPVPLARPGRCHAPLRGEPAERVTGILEAAAQFRLQRKSARFESGVRSHGRDQMLFQEIATALGYKQNTLPFLLLAQRLPLSPLRRQPAVSEALLFGVAGFLRAADLSVYQSGTRDYVRRLWESWWPQRDALQRLVLPDTIWKAGGARPLNHPQRRLGALAVLVEKWGELTAAVATPDPGRIGKFFAGLAHPFWEHHYTLTAAPTARPMALVGASRVAELLANVFFPASLAEGHEVWPAYAALPARLANRRAETAATRLFGDDPRRKQFTRTVAHQQGLLQIYEDFCLQDDSDCAHCPFPEQMQKWP